MSGIVNSTGARSGVIGTTVGTSVGTVIGRAYLVAVDDSTTHQGSTTGWTLRILNTKVFGDSCGCPVTLGSNEFSFDEVGTYIIDARAPNYNSNRNILRLMYDTGTTEVAVGMAQYANVNTTTSHVSGQVTITSGIITSATPRTYGLYMACQTAISGNGHGVNNTSVTTEQYLQVNIAKIQV